MLPIVNRLEEITILHKQIQFAGTVQFLPVNFFSQTGGRNSLRRLFNFVAWNTVSIPAKEGQQSYKSLYEDSHEDNLFRRRFDNINRPGKPSAGNGKLCYVVISKSLKATLHFLPEFVSLGKFANGITQTIGSEIQSCIQQSGPKPYTRVGNHSIVPPKLLGSVWCVAALFGRVKCFTLNGHFSEFWVYSILNKFHRDAFKCVCVGNMLRCGINA